MGWEKLWFLDGLHSKLYIGDSSVIVGSANLSNNGLSLSGNEELCVRLSQESLLEEASRLFWEYLQKAKKSYPDERSKRDRLEELREKHRKAIVNQLIHVPLIRAKKSIFDYDPDYDGMVYIAWYVDGEFDYTDAIPQPVQDDIKKEVHLAPTDMRPTNQWILTWKQTSRGYADRRTKPDWVYVHKVFSDACDDEEYEMMCIQCASLTVPQEPFDAKDKVFVDAFWEVIDQPEFEGLRGIENGVWRLRDNQSLMREFLNF
ncbi:phospholipase D-like domain-containing protein [Halorhodospira halochloris]|uniref:phospholipase D family protein n=1 Tax=Halorhodospira halochloris TaxID=1052 RepID=UPI003B8A6491